MNTRERNKIIARNARVRKKAEFSQLSEEYEQALSINKRLRQCILKEFPPEISEKVLCELSSDIYASMPCSAEFDVDSSDDDVENQQELTSEGTVTEAYTSSKTVSKTKGSLVRTRKSKNSLSLGTDSVELPVVVSSSVSYPDQTLGKSSNGYKSIVTSSTSSAPSLTLPTPCQSSILAPTEVSQTENMSSDPILIPCPPTASPRPVINDVRNLAPISPWPIISGGITDILQVAEDMDRLYPQMDIKFPTPRIVGGGGDGGGRLQTTVNQVITRDPKRPQHRQQPAAHSASFFNSYNIPSFFMGV